MRIQLLPVLIAAVAALEAAAAPFKVQLPDEPKPWEKTAAEELEHYLSLCLGDNPLTVDGQDGVVFHVGDTAFARKKLASQGGGVFKDEEWCVKSFGRDVVLAGGGMRGTLYAVYHFLEDDCGVRWWMDGDEDVPPAKPLAFAALRRRGKPFFACRNIYRFGKSDPRTAVRNRLNDNGSSPIPAALGGAFTYGPPDLAHTWDMYLPFEKHGAEHPEWYALVGGKRIGGQHVAQMCLTCPGLADEFSRRLEGFIAKGEAEAAAKGLPAPRIYDISMNDNMRFCQCEACAEETAKYGHSGRQLRFVNAIAERAAARHPDLLFSTFAYYYSEPPPSNGVCAADNVVVRLCNTRQNMAAGIFDADNRFMHDQVLAWGKFTRNLFVWDYGVTYGKGKGYPFPNEAYIFEKFRFYADNGVTGFLVEHESPECADMYELKYWLECKAMENPYRDPKPLIKDFMTRFYGAARDKVWKARRLLDRRRRERKAFISWFPTTGEFNFISDDDLAEFERLFDEAAAAVRGDAKREARVERAYASIRRLTDFRRKFGAKHPPEEGVSDKPFFDFPARSGNWVLHDAANVAYVKDPDLGDALEGGETVIRFNADGDALYKLPFELGVYDLANRRTVALKTWEKQLGPGYLWYSLGRVTLPERSFLAYVTRKWTAQLPVSLPGMNGSTFEVKALVKFTGPMFFEGSAEPNEIRVARLAYVEPRAFSPDVNSAVSPDGRNEIRLYSNPLAYEVVRDGVVVAAKTEIGLEMNGENVGKGVERPCDVRRTKQGGVLPSPVYKKGKVDLSANKTFVDFGEWGVRLAARNDGVAYRFETKKPGVIDCEKADVTIRKSARCWFNRTQRTSLGCEETMPEFADASDLKADGAKAFYLPFVYSVDGKTVAVAESDVRNYPVLNFGDVEASKGGVKLKSLFAKYPKATAHSANDGGWIRRKIVAKGGRWIDVLESEDFIANAADGRVLPWRIFMMADSPSKLCEADIVYALAEPAEAGSDFSWVRPGKVAWDWWNAFDNKGDPEGCTTATYERFIDFAAANGVEYVILDEGWSAALDIWKFSPRVDVPHLVSYASKKGVGIILWMAWAQVCGDEEHVAEHFAKLGAKGFKVDFMDRADAKVAVFLEKFAAACAKHHMLVDYHGAYRPVGLHRKYPNVLNYEGIHGLENLKSAKRDKDMCMNDVACFFVRMTAGPMDYTPGAMDNYKIGDYRGDCTNPGSVGTRCHQMALMALYEAPLQMLSDSPTKYEKNMECFSFMAKTPVVWDATIGLGGCPESFAAVARKAKDGSWYVAAISNKESRDFAFNTGFLGGGEWKAEVFRDAGDADENPMSYIHETKAARAGEELSFHMASGGGFVVKFSKLMP